MLPNLLIIGAAKAGTTSLHHYLAQHPQVEMSAPKELRFFSHEANWARGVEWYDSQFTSDRSVRGESSPAYTQFRRFPEVPARVHRVLPDAKLIYLVRDPVERLLSHYAFSVATGRERDTLDEAVLAPDSRYVDCSMYYTQVSRYFDYFEPSRILVVSSDDLRNQQRATLARIFRFLGIDDAFWSMEFARTFNGVGAHRLRTETGLRIETLNRLSIVQAIPQRWRIAAGRWIYRPFSRAASRPILDDRLRGLLAARLEDDVARFREWTGQRFDAWSV